MSVMLIAWVRVLTSGTDVSEMRRGARDAVRGAADPPYLYDERAACGRSSVYVVVKEKGNEKPDCSLRIVVPYIPKPPR